MEKLKKTFDNQFFFNILLFEVPLYGTLIESDCYLAQLTGFYIMTTLAFNELIMNNTLGRKLVTFKFVNATI